MNVNKVVLSVILFSLKVIAFILVILLIVRGGQKAYQFGKAVFLDEAIEGQEDARTITVVITKEDTRMDIANMLARKELIRNAKVFYVQEYLYEEGRHLKPGSYELNTAMNASEIMKTIASQSDQAVE